MVLLISLGCSKDAAMVSLEHQEELAYFNSEKAAKELYMVYTNFFKTGNYDYLLKSASVKYYRDGSSKKGNIVLFDEVSKKKFRSIPQTSSESILYYSNKILEGITNYENDRLSTFYTKNDTKVPLIFLDNKAKFIYEYVNSIDCYKWTTISGSNFRDRRNNCTLLQFKNYESYDMLDVAYDYNKNRAKIFFRNLYDKNNKRTIFKDEKQRVKKIVDYKKMNIKYYYYNKQYKYEINCNYIDKTCMIEDPKK